MCGKRRLLVILAGVAAGLPAVMLWDATGRRVFTFFPSDDPAKLQQAKEVAHGRIRWPRERADSQ